ncbi:hypothetical protein PMI42_01689 [Bradyrhizobium sp. YR681]|uniref:DUF7220 family protein n=1 Tax=Bradyrhizobium sp. YR681 TaxID=1144344 RepID=UPI0002712A3C|nr:hypothetical protein [Bradyrhizobium sp. YR681]EJN14716.1 hypothetical protein PMI42_01689 [Bradyrhizobium sp. YR681]
MKQSRLMSFMETILSTAIGFAVALLTQIFVFPLFGFHPALLENLMITAIFTVVSIARQFVMRRIFEALHIRRPLSAFVQAVVAERFRQIEQEGWSIEHDDLQHDPGELAQAGATYALHAGEPLAEEKSPPVTWPWAWSWWKPAGFRRDLVKACALIIAEGEKFDRARKRGK